MFSIAMGSAASDADVANYFQVNMPRMNLIDAAAMNLAGQTNNPNDFYLAKYPNATPKLFGMRFMETDTQMGGVDSLGRADGQSSEVVKREQGKARLWIDDRRAQLMDVALAGLAKGARADTQGRSRTGTRPWRLLRKRGKLDFAGPCQRGRTRQYPCRKAG